MIKQYTKTAIASEISEDGGATIQFVNKTTVPLDGAITEALDGNYAIGNKTLVRNIFFGLMRSMSEGVMRDGHARQIGDFLTIYPVFKGEVDLERGFDPDENYVLVKARLLNEMELDISKWSFQDVTAGKKPFTLESVVAGEEIGVVKLGEEIHLNGRELPLADEGVRVEWEVEGADKRGEASAEQITSALVDRIDLASETLAELASSEYDGKTIVFTVRGNFSNAKKSAKLRYVAPTGPTITKVTSDGPVEDDHLAVSKNHVLGTGLALGEGDHVYLRLIDTDGTVLEDNSQDHRVTSSTDTEITSGDSGFWPDDSEYPDGEWDEEGRTVKLRVVKADGTAAERRVYLDDGE